MLVLIKVYLRTLSVAGRRNFTTVYTVDTKNGLASGVLSVTLTLIPLGVKNGLASGVLSVTMT